MSDFSKGRIYFLYIFVSHPKRINILVIFFGEGWTHLMHWIPVARKKLATHHRGSVAEWSKALVLGTSPKGRGFESHRRHYFFVFVSKGVGSAIRPSETGRLT